MKLIEETEQLGKEEIDVILNAVINRKRKLYPDWEILYFAQKRGEEENSETVLKLLFRNSNNKQ